MKCEICDLDMGVWNFTNKVWHCRVCGNVVIEDFE